MHHLQIFDLTLTCKPDGDARIAEGCNLQLAHLTLNTIWVPSLGETAFGARERAV